MGVMAMACAVSRLAVHVWGRIRGGISGLIVSTGLGARVSRVHTHVDEISVIAFFEDVQHGSVIEVGHVGHVFALFIFRRVHLLQKLLLDGALFVGWVRVVSE